MAKQYLNGTYIPGLAIDQGDLGPAKRVCSVAGRLNADLMKPSFEQARIVARGEAGPVVPSGGEQEITFPGPPLAYPGEDAVARSLRHLEANRRSRLLLNDQRSASHDAAGQHVANPQLNEIAAPELAVDCEVEESKVSRSALPFQMEPD